MGGGFLESFDGIFHRRGSQAIEIFWKFISGGLVIKLFNQLLQRGDGFAPGRAITRE